MDLQALASLVGILDALLIFGIVVIWREWRKTEAKVVDLLTKQIKSQSEMIQQYNSFETVLSNLAEVMKGE